MATDTTASDTTATADTTATDATATTGAQIGTAEEVAVEPSDRTAYPLPSPTTLARLVVGRYGTVAARRAQWLRDTYPSVDADRLVGVPIRTAQGRTRIAALAAALPLGAPVSVAAQMWTNARLVLDVAAVYGFDATADDRVPELLALLDLYPDVPAARAAVANEDAVVPPIPRIATAAAALARRTASRLVPGSGVVLAELRGAAAVDALAGRAVRFYRRQARPVNAA
jgi:hypothetical protein